MRPLAAVAWDWACRCFGNQMRDTPTRAIRTLEEVAEFCQAVGVDREQAYRVVTTVYSRPAGEALQELGGVLMTSYLLCAQWGVDPEEVFLRELRRVLAKEAGRPGTFAERNQEKVDLGLGEKR